MDIAIVCFALYGLISVCIEIFLLLNGKARRAVGRRMMGY